MGKDNKGESIETAYYEYKKGDYESFQAELSKINWNEIFEDGDVIGNWSKFKCILFDLRERFINRKYGKVLQSRNAFWMTKKLSILIRRTNVKWKKFSREKSYASWKRFTTARNEATKQIRKAKFDYEIKLAKNIKSKKKVSTHM